MQDMSAEDRRGVRMIKCQMVENVPCTHRLYESHNRSAQAQGVNSAQPPTKAELHVSPHEAHGSSGEAT